MAKAVNATAIDEVVESLNRVLADGDAATIQSTLGRLARERGMSHIAREAGLARENLYRSLSASAHPEFTTILKVFNALGLRLEAKPEGHKSKLERAPVHRRTRQDQGSRRIS
jgi:probable addiction module antidote protein